MDIIKLDFEQARAKHLLFKSRLRSILYGVKVDEAPVLSHHECSVGQWIYGHALKAYGSIPEMQELEKIHADIHTSARELVEMYKKGKVEEARLGLIHMEKIADQLVELLTTVEKKLDHKSSTDEHQHLQIKFDEFKDLLNSNVELDKRIKQQVAETVKQKERFDLIAKATQDAIWDWDLVTNDLWWNTGFREMFGYKEEERGIDSWYNKLHPDDKDKIVTGIHKVIDNGGSRWEDEYRFKKADGTYAYVYDRGYALHDKEGKPIRMVGSMVDFTRRKEAEDKLKQVYEDLEVKVTFRNLELEKLNKENLQKIEALEKQIKELQNK